MKGGEEEDKVREEKGKIDSEGRKRSYITALFWIFRWEISSENLCSISYYVVAEEEYTSGDRIECS